MPSILIPLIHFYGDHLDFGAMRVIRLLALHAYHFCKVFDSKLFSPLERFYLCHQLELFHLMQSLTTQLEWSMSQWLPNFWRILILFSTEVGKPLTHWPLQLVVRDCIRWNIQADDIGLGGAFFKGEKSFLKPNPTYGSDRHAMQKSYHSHGSKIKVSVVHSRKEIVSVGQKSKGTRNQEVRRAW